MSLEKIYGISTETVKKMLDNGDMSCSVVRQHEIYDYYLSYKFVNPTKNKSEIFNDLSDFFKVSASTVKLIVYRLDKKS